MSSDEYFSAEEELSDFENSWDEFFIYTTTDGTRWYLPLYYRPELELLIDYNMSWVSNM